VRQRPTVAQDRFQLVQRGRSSRFQKRPIGMTRPLAALLHGRVEAGRGRGSSLQLAGPLLEELVVLSWLYVRRTEVSIRASPVLETSP